MLGIAAIIAIIWVIRLIYTTETFGCDFDCYHCPFPECSTKEKEWLKKHMK